VIFVSPISAVSPIHDALERRNLSMKIANLQNVIASEAAQKETESALASGEAVLLQSPIELSLDMTAVNKYLETFGTRIEVGRSALSDVQMLQASTLAQTSTPSALRSSVLPQPQPVARTSNAQAVAMGAGGGALVGASVGVLIEQLRSVHPTSAIAVDVACGVIGSVLGGALATGKFSIEGSCEITQEGKKKFGVMIAPVTAK
jgi:hypothetical protein